MDYKSDEKYNKGLISLIDKLNNPNYNVNSKFLKEYYDENKRVNIKRSGFNPRDPFGKRLSEFWKPGDNIFTVSIKKTINFFYILLNPDTYSKENFKKLKREYVLNETMIYMAGLTLTMIFLLYLPFIQPRIKRAKDEYLLHQYFKKRFFEEELNLGKKNVRLSKMNRILKKIHDEYKP